MQEKLQAQGSDIEAPFLMDNKSVRFEVEKSASSAILNVQTRILSRRVLYANKSSMQNFSEMETIARCSVSKVALLISCHYSLFFLLHIFEIIYTLYPVLLTLTVIISNEVF